MSSPIYKTTAFNLKYTNYSEADRIYTILSREFGLLQVIAKGIRKSKSKFSGRMDLLHCNNLILRKGKNLDIVIGCDTYKFFPGLTQDYDRITSAFYLSELVHKFSNKGESDPNLFDLLVNTLEVLSETYKPQVYILWFEIKLLINLGYIANYSRCVCCQDYINLYPQDKLGFDLNSGSIICKKCCLHLKSYKQINYEEYTLLNDIRNLSLKDIENFKLNVSHLKKLQSLIQNYILKISEQKFKSISLLNV